MERNHHSVDVTIQNLCEEDEDIKLDDALPKAIYSYNIQITKHGFSPNQVVYERANIIPRIVDGSPATDKPLEKELFKKEMLRRYKAEQIYRFAEIDEKIQRMLAQNA